MIVERLHNGVVAIDTDAAQMENTRGAEIDVQAVPHIAHEVPEEPSVEDFHAEVETHRAERDEHVGEGEAHHEVVGDDAEFPMTHHGDNYQKIPEDRTNNDKQHEKDFQRYEKTYDETSFVRVI